MTEASQNGTVKTRTFWEKLSQACRSALTDQLDIDEVAREEFADEVGITYERLNLSLHKHHPQLPNKTHEYVRLLLRMDAENVIAALSPILAEKGLMAVSVPSQAADMPTLRAIDKVLNISRAEEGR